MTVSNVLFEDDRIRLVSDTVGYIDRNPVVFHRKIRVVRHARVVFMVRGRRVLADELEARSVAWPNFEQAVIGISTHLVQADEGLFQKGGLAEISVAGWDHDRPRFSRLMATLGADGVDMRRVDLSPGAYLAPSLGSHPIPAAMTDEQLLKVSLLQQEISIRHGLNICIGGDIEIATIDAKHIGVRKLGEYPNKRLTEAQVRRARLSWSQIVAA